MTIKIKVKEAEDEKTWQEKLLDFIFKNLDDANDMNIDIEPRDNPAQMEVAFYNSINKEETKLYFDFEYRIYTTLETAARSQTSLIRKIVDEFKLRSAHDYIDELLPIKPFRSTVFSDTRYFNGEFNAIRFSIGDIDSYNCVQFNINFMSKTFLIRDEESLIESINESVSYREIVVEMFKKLVEEGYSDSVKSRRLSLYDYLIWEDM